jgi:hypothetical protein
MGQQHPKPTSPIQAFKHNLKTRFTANLLKHLPQEHL